jgi:hypothetical protein
MVLYRSTFMCEHAVGFFLHVLRKYTTTLLLSDEFVQCMHEFSREKTTQAGKLKSERLHASYPDSNFFVGVSKAKTG